MKVSRKLQQVGFLIWNSDWFIVALYLIVIVIANVTVSLWGPGVSVLNAFLLVGFSLTARDRLHDSWHNRRLKTKMTLLILAGSGLSYILGAGQIALASMVAFGVSEVMDTLVYSRLATRRKLEQVNGSNVASAAVDSITFPLIAFGWPPLVGIMLLQFVAKVGGGFLWSLVLVKMRER